MLFYSQTAEGKRRAFEGRAILQCSLELSGKKVLASFNCCAIFIGSALKATMVER